MQIPNLSKRIRKTIVVFGSVIAWVIGFAANLPQAMSNIEEWGPEWAADPNTWWFAFVFVVAAVALWIIHKQPDADDRQQLYEKMIDSVSGDSLHVRELMMLLLEIYSFKDAVLEAEKLNVEYALHKLEIVFPARIKHVLGQTVCNRYKRAVEHSKNESQDVYIISETALPMIESEIWKEFEKEEVNSVEPTP